MPLKYILRRGAQGFCLLALAVLLAGCPGGDGNVGTTTPPPPHPAFTLGLEQINTGFNLTFPLFLTAPPGDMLRLFVVEKGGLIKIVDRTNNTLIGTFLDISGLVSTGGEQGLLGLVFHPNFELNGFFYVNLINLNGDTEIRRYHVPSITPNVADPMSALLIISIDQPATLTNHKAGWLGFGQDGFLYAALGDGGGGGDPSNNAQNLNSLLGKMLRLDVNDDDFRGDPLKNYAIPGNNPFVGAIPGFDEIWAYGLRNPWRSSFDRGTGDFYIADVGQGAREEVNASTVASGGGMGLNFGWDIMEGSLCHEPMQNCSVVGFVQPLEEYDHTQGCSITGGYVYRGTVIPALQGTYFYGDYCAGFVRSFRLAGDVATERADWPSLGVSPGNITSFGEDASGELYIVTQQGGLFRIVPM